MLDVALKTQRKEMNEGRKERKQLLKLGLFLILVLPNTAKVATGPVTTGETDTLVEDLERRKSQGWKGKQR